MKKSFVILIAIITFLLGYLAGNVMPINSGSTAQKSSFTLPGFGDQGIKGDTVLHVTLEMKDTKNRIENVEVDLAKEPGAPPVGGTSLSDENGVATFNVKPGNYFIFFNANNFPKNLETPESQPVEVKAGETNEVMVLLKLK